MNLLGIFAKQPVPGRVKTRLADAVGPERTARLYSAFITDIAARFRSLADRRFLCYAPDDRQAVNYFSEISRTDYQLWLQPDLSLGERMAAFFEYAFSLEAQRVVVIGSDSPTLPEELVNRAFTLLEETDCVLGPATDGGYYLVGQQSPGFPIFASIEWSSSGVLHQTAERIAACHARLALLSPWYDVDTLNDLTMLRGHLRALHQAGVAVRLDATETILNEETDSSLGDQSTN